MDLIFVGFAAIFIGIIAHVRGRSAIGWFLLTIALVFGFAIVIYFYLVGFNAGPAGDHVFALLTLIPFLYGSPVATFLVLVALPRQEKPVKPVQQKAKPDPLAAMTQRAAR